MSTAIGWNASASGHVGNVKARWREVRGGLGLVLLGYVVLLLLILPGGALIWVTESQQYFPRFQKHVAINLEWASWIGWILVVAGAVLGQLMVLCGQSRCLHNASSREGAREMLFTCLLAGLAGPACLLLAVVLGSDPRQLFVSGQQPGEILKFFQGPGALHLAGASLLLFNLLLFTGFLRMVAKNVAPARVSRTTAFFWFAAFLVGMTAGTSYKPQAEVWQWLAIGWGLLLLGNALLNPDPRRSVHGAPPCGGSPP